MLIFYNWCYWPSIGTLHISWHNLLYRCTWLASRNHFAKSLHVFWILHSGLHILLHDIFLWSWFLHLWAHTFSTFHHCRLCKIWLIPKVHSVFLDELFLVCSWWYKACNHEINYVRVPGVGVHNLEECVISKEIINGQILCIFELHSRQMIGNIIFYSLFYLLFRDQPLRAARSMLINGV